MGDASPKVEKEILSKYQLSVDYLKVGHHGSNTSSSYEFLKKMDPSYAIISAGRNNRYHHPSLETISNLEALDIASLNTQDKGTIEIRISKNKTNIFTSFS